MADPGTTTTYKVRVTDSKGCWDEDEVVVSVWPVPEAAAGADTGFCTGGSVQLSGDATGGTSPYSYDWTGPETHNDTQNPTVSTAGTYTLTVTDSKGCWDTDTVVVTSWPIPDCTITCSDGDCTICEGDSVILSVTNVAAYTYSWSLSSGGAFFNTNSSVTVTPASTTTYYVTVTDTTTGCFDECQQTVTVLEQCGSDAPPIDICEGTVLNDVLFYDAGADCNGPECCESTLNYENVNPDVPGVIYQYTVTCECPGSGCEPTIETGTVTVYPTPDCVITIDGNTASVTDAGPNATYLWSITNGSIDSGQGTNTITFSTGTGPSTLIEVEITTDDGCTASCQEVIAVVQELGSISNYVWHDLNCDGIQDSGETGVDGVLVRLYKSTGEFVAEMLTSGGGFYLFGGLEEGTYYVEFIKPSNYDFAPQNTGTDDAIDSDASPITGRTEFIALSNGENDDTWDAGLCKESDNKTPPDTPEEDPPVPVGGDVYPVNKSGLITRMICLMFYIVFGSLILERKKIAN